MRRYHIQYGIKDSVWESEVRATGTTVMTGVEFPVADGITLIGPSVAEPRKGRLPATVLAVVDEASWEKLPPPIWVEIGRPQSTDEVVAEASWKTVKHATNRARALLVGETEPREFVVDFVHTEEPGNGYRLGSNRPEVREIVRA